MPSFFDAPPVTRLQDYQELIEIEVNTFLVYWESELFTLSVT